MEVGEGGGGERRRGARRCRARRDVSTRNELAWLHQISEASKRQEKQELRRQIVGEVGEYGLVEYEAMLTCPAGPDTHHATQQTKRRVLQPGLRDARPPGYPSVGPRTRCQL